MKSVNKIILVEIVVYNDFLRRVTRHITSYPVLQRIPQRILLIIHTQQLYAEKTRKTYLEEVALSIITVSISFIVLVHLYYRLFFGLWERFYLEGRFLCGCFSRCCRSHCRWRGRVSNGRNCNLGCGFRCLSCCCY